MATDDVDSFLRSVASAPAVRPPPRVGERLGGRYVIEAFLGEGGMGSVFRALDEKLGEQVALKIVKPGLDEAALRDEVRLAQKVTHVNVCRTFDLEDVDGRSIVKMEYVAGETLATRLEREGKLPIDEAVRIARAIAAGLGVAHAQGIVHSDLKPGNVMLAEKRVVLMDFGVAHLAASPNEGVHGTVGYLAPEKLRELSGDARSDEYALGCVLYEMLAGERVFGTGAAIATAARHVSDPVPDVRTKRPEVPHWLARATTRLLAKEPESRATGVAQLVSGPPSRLRIAVPATLLVLVAALIGWRLVRSPPWSARYWNARVHFEDVEEPAVSPDGAWIVFSTDLNSPPDSRSQQLAITSTRTVGEPLRLQTSSEFVGVSSPQWRDNHTLIYIAATATDRRVYQQHIEWSPPHLTGTPTLVTPRDADDVMSSGVCGDSVAYVRWNFVTPLELWSSRTNKPLYVALGGQTLSSPRCDPKGERIVFVVGASFFGDGDLYVVDLATGDGPRRLTTDSSIEGDATFSADGKSIVAARSIDGKMQLYELPSTGEGEWRRLTFDDGPDFNPVVSQNGNVLAFVRDTSQFFTTISGKAEDTGKPVAITKEQASHIRPHSIDSDHIVTQRSGTGPSEVAVVTITTQEVRRLDFGTDPFPSSDGKTVYYVPRGTSVLAQQRRVLAKIPLSSAPGMRGTYVATLPGKIVGGCGSPDGIHVEVELDGKYSSYRIKDNEISDDHAHGLVCVSSTGWRAITTFADKLHPKRQLTIEAPDGKIQTIDVQSLFNRWLDDRRVTYCLKDCFVLDVLTQKTTVVGTTEVGGALAVVTDDLRIVDWSQTAQATLHAITNFADR